VEIWTEKDAVAAIMYEETETWDVPLLAGRGYASHSFLYSTAEYIQEIGKPAYIYYFGDYDPRGLDIARFVEEHLREYAEGVAITFTRVALTREQIDRWRLPTRPTKREKSGFGRDFDPDSVDIDTMDPRDLRALVRACITSHIGQRDLDVLQLAEQEEQRFLQWMSVQSPVLREEARRAGAIAADQRGSQDELIEILRQTLNAYMAAHDTLSWDEIVGAARTIWWAYADAQQRAEGRSC